jgi:hypothetical protein
MSSEAESTVTQTPSASPELEGATPVPQKPTLPHHTPTDSLVSVSLSESDKKSEQRESGQSEYSLETTPKDVVHEVLRRASAHTSPIEFMISEKILDSPGADVRLVQELAFEKEKARSRSNSTVASTEFINRERSDSAGSETSIQVDWDTLDRTEQQTQDDESDEVCLII